MATTKITDLTAYTDPVNTDVLPIVDVTSDVTKKVSIANVMKNASLGTAAAPGIAFDGDPNTGIYSPAANQVAITTDGTQRMLIDSAGAVTIAGDLTVNGTTTNINTQNLVVEDKNIVLGDVTSPTDVTADGGGITLKGTTDKTINWVDSTDAWTSSENVDVASGKSYRINGTEVLSATALGSAVQISSSNIPSGTIVNDDVNASAAIAGTKISPDFGSQTVQTTGIFSHALGTAGAPTVTFTGDTNTGIYSPGADQVAISTNGAGRLFVAANGNIGVNKSSPSGQLHIQPTSADDVDLYLQAGGLTQRSRIFFQDSGGTNAGSIVYGHDSDFLSFTTNSSERLRITSAGLVGVGTSSPDAPLHVVSGSGLIRNAVNDGTSAGTAIYALNSFNGAYDMAQLTATQGASFINPVFKIRVSDTSKTLQDRLTINSSGQVGIGTTSVSSQLHVAPSSDGDFTNGLRVSRAGDANQFGVINYSGGALNFIATDASASNPITRFFRSTNGTTTTETARFDSSGRLLVGTSSARSNFYNAGTISPQMQIEGTTYSTSTFSIVTNNASGTGGYPSLVFGKSAGSTIGSNTAVTDGHYLGEISFQGNDGSEFVDGARITAVVDGTSGANDLPTRLVFSTTGDGAVTPTERMRITSGGLLRLKSSTLHFDGGGSGCGDINFNNESGTNYYSIRTNTGDFYISDSDFSNYARLNGQAFTAWTFASDARIKENIVDCEYGIETIKRIKARRFNFVNSDQSVVGFIAQELKDVIPEAVTGSEVPFAETDTPAERAAKTMSVSKDSLFPVLVTSLQEAIGRIETLEAEVAALKAQ